MLAARAGSARDGPFMRATPAQCLVSPFRMVSHGLGVSSRRDGARSRARRQLGGIEVRVTAFRADDAFP